ncbi:hypothetical protein HID58_088568, partial [Brassica napus]
KKWTCEHNPLLFVVIYINTTKAHIWHTPKSSSLHFLYSSSSLPKRISLPLFFPGLLLYFRYYVSLYFLGGLGRSTLAGGSLALDFANITCYSLFSGLTMGVESICFPAFRAIRATIQRGLILLLLTSLPVSLLWIKTKKILEMLKQDEDLAAEAHIFLLYSVPDLLRSRIFSNLPITFLLVQYLGFGIKGIALSGVLSNFNLVVFLVIYIAFLEEKQSSDEEVLEESYEDSLREGKKLLLLAIPIPIEMIMAFWFGFGSSSNQTPVIDKEGGQATAAVSYTVVATKIAMGVDEENPQTCRQRKRLQTLP